MHNRIYLSVLTTLSLFIGSVGEELPIIDLEPYESTHSLLVEHTEVRTGGKVDIVSSEIIDSLHAGDLTAALRRLPGVTISRYNPVGAYGGSDGGAIFIRGHGAGRPGSDISIMIDGVPLFVGIWSHPLIDTISTDLASSIQVFKSPQPTLTGNMSFASINVLPKHAVQQGFHGRVEGSYGYWNTSLAKIETSYLKGNTGWFMGVSNRSSDGHRDNADGETTALFANVFHSFNEDWKVSMLMNHTDANASDPEMIGTVIPITERYASTNHFYLGKLEGSFSDLDLTVRLHYENGEADWTQWHQAPPPPFPSQQLNTITQYGNYGAKAKLTGANSLLGHWTVGMDWDRFGGDVDEVYAITTDNHFAEESFHLFAPHASFEKKIAPSKSTGEWIVSGGVRHMNHSVFDAEWAGQLGVVYRTTTADYYAHYSNSRNYPGVYVSVFGRRPAPWNVGDNWKDLESEHIQHHEVGVKWNPNSTFSLDISFFNDEVDNSIRFVTPPPSGYITNIGNYTIKGIESHLRYGIRNTQYFIAGTWLDTSEEIPNTPDWTATIGFRTDWDGFSISADGQFISEQSVVNPRFASTEQTVDECFIIHARIQYEFGNGEQTDWRVYLQGENLSNQSYEYRPGYAMPGTNFTMGISKDW